MVMSKAEVQEAVKEYHKKIHILEDKLHAKTLEVERLLHNKTRPNVTFDESQKMHKRIMKIYVIRETLAKDIASLRKEKDDLINNWRLSQLL